MFYLNFQGMKWPIQLIVIVFFLIVLNVTTDIGAESILGCKDNSETKEFETCKIDENDLVKGSTISEKAIKDEEKNQLFLSEGGWYVNV